MGTNGREPAILELVPAPVIEFDDFGDVVVVNGKCFWPLYAERPSLHGGGIERHLVGWAVASNVARVHSMIERTVAALRACAALPASPEFRARLS